MGIISGIKSMFNVSAWVGTEQIKTQTRALTDIAKDLTTPKTAARTESFEEALARLNLTEDDINRRKADFQRFVMIFSVLATAIFIYIIYLLIEKSWLPSIGCFGIFLVMLGQVFRYHFWLYQIRERKLGCTLREWLKQLGGKA